MSSTTTERLLLLLSLLQTRRDWPGSVLAGRLDISHRTVRRDVDRLREMGYRIEATLGPDGGYRLEAGTDLPPLLFDDEQAIALAVALHAAVITGAGIEEAAVRALTTVRQVMPARLRHRLDALSFTTLPAASRPSTGQVSADLLVALSAAVRARETLRFDYTTTPPARSDDEVQPPRQVEPHHLVTSGRRWYLLGWDLAKGDWRTYRVDRMTLRLPHGRRFEPREIPGGDVGEFVAARFKGSARADVWPCVGRVILHLPAREVAPYAGDGTIEDLGPHRCGLELGSWSWTALAASLGRFDAEVEVVGPTELSEAFAVLAGRFAATAERFAAAPERPTRASGDSTSAPGRSTGA